MTYFVDSMTITDAPKRVNGGYMAVSARVAKAGNVQKYLGKELGMKDRAVVRVYRPEEAVFNLDAVKTYAGVPITMGHPTEKVSATNWKTLAVGEVGDDVLRDGEFIRVPMLVRDAQAIAQIEAGVCELSMGYDCKVELRDGVAPNGEAYDAVMSGFTMNHVAVVPEGRGGPELRIGDAAADYWGARPIHDEQEKTMQLRPIAVGDKAFTVNDEGAQAIELLKGQLAAKDKEIADAKATHEAALAVKDAALAAKDAALAEKDKLVLTDAALDQRVAARADLITRAKTLVPTIVTDGVADADIRRAVVAARAGDAAIKDATPAYVDAYFDIIAKDAKPVDSFRSAAQPAPGTPPVHVGDAATVAYNAMTADLTSAWSKKAN